MRRLELISLDTLANIFVSVLFLVKFCLFEHDMICAVEISSNSRIKRACGILLVKLQEPLINLFCVTT